MAQWGETESHYEALRVVILSDGHDTRQAL